MAYVPCKDPSCVDLGLLYTRGLDTLKARGTKLARNLWAYPADPSNYRAANRNKSHIDQIVIHTAEGYTGGLDTFRDPARNASAHYAVQWDGTVAQMVPEKDIAWHAGGYIGTNDRSVGIEHVGFAYAMQPGTQTEWSKDLLLSSAKLVASIARRYGVPLDRQHIIAHDDVPGQDHTDPGPYWPWEWYLRRVKWYYYRPYVLAGVGTLTIGALVLWRVRSERKRVAGWSKV